MGEAPDGRLSRRFWVQATLCAFTAALFVLTQVWPDWIEGVFGVDPDDGDGKIEWVVLVVLILVTATSFALARRELHRTDQPPVPVGRD